MLVHKLCVSILSWILIDAANYHSKGLLDRKQPSTAEFKKLNYKNKFSFITIINANIKPARKEVHFKTSESDMETSEEMQLDTNGLIKKVIDNVGISSGREGSQFLFLNSNGQTSSSNQMDLNESSQESTKNYSHVDDVKDAHVEEMNISDVIKNISKRSTSARNCFLSERSTCPWYYDDNGNAQCSQSIPVGCHPDHCLLRCHLLYSNNRAIACVSSRPCLIQARGQEMSSCL